MEHMRVRQLNGHGECCICFELIANHNVVILDCLHKFHATCLHAWFRCSHNIVCPICQTGNKIIVEVLPAAVKKKRGGTFKPRVKRARKKCCVLL